MRRRKKKKGEERENDEEEEKIYIPMAIVFVYANRCFNIHAETSKSEQWQNYTLDSMQ